MRTETEKLGTEPVLPLLLRLALPSLIGLLVSNLYVLVDRVFVGRYVGAGGLAAMSAAMPLAMIIFAIAILIGRGSSVLYSISLGKKDYREAQHLFGVSIFLIMVSSLVITVAGLLFLDPLLHLFGVPESALPYGRSYLSISLFGTIFVMLSFQNNLIRAEGYSQLAMLTQFIGAIANVALDYLFMAVFDWGMAGAAWATVISQGLSSLWVMHFFWSGKSVVKLEWRYIRFGTWERLGKILYNGCSPFAINILGSVIWTVQNHMLLRHGGEYAMAAFGIILSVAQLLMTPLFGISMGMQPLVGYNTGAKHYDRVIAIFYQSVKLAAVFAIVPYLLVEVFSTQIIDFFVDKDSEQLIEVGVYAMRRYLLLFPLSCGTILVSQYFQGVGRAPVAMLVAITRQMLFQLPLTFILPVFFGFDGVIFSGPVGDTLAFLVAFWLMRRELKKLHVLQKRHLLAESVAKNS